MNWQRKHNENTYFINLYLEFMQHTALPYQKALNLMAEITRLNHQNAYIENMSVEDYQNTEIVTIYQDSKL